MQENQEDINRKDSILVSRNHPLVLLVGVAGFIGSHLADEALAKGIQVVGIDDLSTGKKINLTTAAKNKNFHFLHRSITEDLLSDSVLEVILALPRIDYIFLAVDGEDYKNLYSQGLANFLTLLKKIREHNIKLLSDDGSALEKKAITAKSFKSLEERLVKDRPKIAFISSINLYNNKLDERQDYLKEAEVKFAKFVKYYKFNARVIRLAGVYGPRMNFQISDPLIRLIQASLNDQLDDQTTAMDFTSRALFVDDAVNLIMKSVLVGSTSNKIYDGALIQPIKIAEIKQVLIDPLWHEEKGFNPTELPPWPTPNLIKTTKELAWKPKTPLVEGLKKTIAYFKDSGVEVEKVSESQLKGEQSGWVDDPSPHVSKEELKKWSFKNYEESERKENVKGEGVVDSGEVFEGNSHHKKGLGRISFKRGTTYLIIFMIIFIGLFYPVMTLAVGGLSIRNNLKTAKAAIEVGDFEKAKKEIDNAKNALNGSKQLIDSLGILRRLGILNRQLDQADKIIGLSEEGIDGVDHAVLGSQSLFLATKVISGEQNADPKPLYETASIELKSAKDQLDSVKSRLRDDDLIEGLPGFITERVADINIKLDLFSGIVERAYTASILLPKITGTNSGSGSAPSKKSYLVLLQNNLELRPAGGFIGSYAKFDFEGGRITQIKVDDIYALDGGFTEVIEPPAEIKSDLGQTRLFLRDANFEPDFPSSARQVELLYKKEAGESVNGVIALDLSASAKLLSAVGGLDLPEYGEHVDGNNLFEKAITHAEASFFPGSQAKKNYLTSLQNQLFNKIFYLSKQNWPAIIEALSASLDEKHVQVYLSDPQLFSYLSSQSWSGVMPRGSAVTNAGLTEDFLAVVESNMGANKANYYLTRKYKLATSIGKEGQINHNLKISYANLSPSEVFPAGKYKNRFKIYLPLGAKINQALYGETVVTRELLPFSDYGRSGFSTFLILNPKEQKTLMIDYSLPSKLSFEGGSAKYSLSIIKQAGTDKDPFDFQLTYPINYKLANSEGNSAINQEVSIPTELSHDRVFSFDFTSSNP